MRLIGPLPLLLALATTASQSIPGTCSNHSRTVVHREHDDHEHDEGVDDGVDAANHVRPHGPMGLKLALDHVQKAVAVQHLPIPHPAPRKQNKEACSSG
eukprot:1190805-Prorocentrum_minimum.AAC.5